MSRPCPPTSTITGLVMDSRAVKPGDAFVAIAGFGAHGLLFAEQAKASGARAMLFEPPAPENAPAPADAIPVPGLRARLGELADRFHDFPSHALTTVGVTGTNGKTSTVQLLAQAWTLARHARGLDRHARRGPVWPRGADRFHHAARVAGASTASPNCATKARRRCRWKSARTRSTRAAWRACISTSACSPTSRATIWITTATWPATAPRRRSCSAGPVCARR